MVQFWGWASNIPAIIEEIYTSLGETLTRSNLETCKKPTRVSKANNYLLHYIHPLKKLET